MVSVERSEKYVRLIAGFRNCEAVGFSEMEPGNKPGKYNRKRVAKQVNNVVKGVAKSCNATAPAVPDLDASPAVPGRRRSSPSASFQAAALTTSCLLIASCATPRMHSQDGIEQRQPGLRTDLWRAHPGR